MFLFIPTKEKDFCDFQFAWTTVLGQRSPFKMGSVGSTINGKNLLQRKQSLF